MAISRSLRFEILRRDGNTCHYCGRSAPDVKLTIDHVIPETLGGTDDPTNLITACADCNGGKSATPPDASTVAEVSADALRWADAVKLAASDMLAKVDERQRDRDEFEQAWNTWGRGTGQHRVTMPLPENWWNSIDRMRASGLPLIVVIESIPMAMNRNAVPDDRKFNYLCGILWNKVSELHDAARGYLGAANEAPAFRREIVSKWAGMVEEIVRNQFSEAEIGQARKRLFELVPQAYTEDEIIFNVAALLLAPDWFGS